MNYLSGEEMGHLLNDSRPIFMQIAERIEIDIIAEELPEKSQVPSTNQFAAFYQINPATAAKGVNLLVDEGILYKKRVLGMFMATGTRAKLIEKRREQFIQQLGAANEIELEIHLREVTELFDRAPRRIQE